MVAEMELAMEFEEMLREGIELVLVLLIVGKVLLVALIELEWKQERLLNVFHVSCVYDAMQKTFFKLKRFKLEKITCVVYLELKFVVLITQDTTYS